MGDHSIDWRDLKHLSSWWICTPDFAPLLGAYVQLGQSKGEVPGHSGPENCIEVFSNSKWTVFWCCWNIQLLLYSFGDMGKLYWSLHQLWITIWCCCNIPVLFTSFEDRVPWQYLLCYCFNTRDPWNISQPSCHHHHFPPSFQKLLVHLLSFSPAGHLFPVCANIRWR